MGSGPAPYALHTPDRAWGPRRPPRRRIGQLSKGAITMRRGAFGILLILVLVFGGGLIAATAYQAGLSTAVTTTVVQGTTTDGGTTVVVPAVGYGWGGPRFRWGGRSRALRLFSGPS